MNKKLKDPTLYVVHTPFRVQGEGVVRVGEKVELTDAEARLCSRKIYAEGTPEADALLGAISNRAKKAAADQKAVA